MGSNQIKYYSTNNKSPETTFSQALLNGIAPDGGLYLPSSIPVLSGEELQIFSGMQYHEVASAVLHKLIGNEINREDLSLLCREAYDFDLPLEKVCDRMYVMRLDQGPTASFKDFAARMMSRLMQHYLSMNKQYLTILTATSGDTGSAVANAFLGMKNIRVVILYPDKEVTLMQRRQMTTLKNNISVLAIDGKFDDCQRLVKMAFLDHDLKHISLSSANSINIGRLLPQSVYYVYSWSKLAAGIEDKAVFSVPSGNFGNLMGGLIAFRMELPVKQFVVSTNANNEVPEFLRTGIYKPVNPSRNCISSAMNVGHPSNLARIIALYGGMMDQEGKILKEPDIQGMRKDLYGVSISDDITSLTISDVFNKYNILLEPHGAIAWQGIREYSRERVKSKSGRQLFIALETAHPAKFPEEIRRITGLEPPVPKSLTGITDKEESFVSLENDYQALKKYIIKEYS